MAWSFDEEAGVIVVEGQVLAPEGSAFAGALAALGTGPAVCLDMLDLELLDGVALAEAVNGLRALRATCDRLELRHAPQMLAHTLYKVGALRDPGLVLVAVRQDEPTTAN